MNVQKYYNKNAKWLNILQPTILYLTLQELEYDPSVIQNPRVDWRLYTLF